jgi:hypothetical protein
MTTWLNRGFSLAAALLVLPGIAWAQISDWVVKIGVLTGLAESALGLLPRAGNDPRQRGLPAARSGPSACQESVISGQSSVVSTCSPDEAERNPGLVSRIALRSMRATT